MIVIPRNKKEDKNFKFSKNHNSFLDVVQAWLFESLSLTYFLIRWMKEYVRHGKKKTLSYVALVNP